MGVRVSAQDWVTDGGNYPFADVDEAVLGLRGVLELADPAEVKQIIEGLELAVKFYEENKK